LIVEDDEKSEIAAAIRYLAHAITDSAAPGTDAQGGRVGCLTEAFMGMTAALTACAVALEGVQEAIENHENNNNVARALDELGTTLGDVGERIADALEKQKSE
jgi:hypothetical protein